MKSILAAVVLGFIALATTTASAQPSKTYEMNWFEQIIQSLTGTACTAKNGTTRDVQTSGGADACRPTLTGTQQQNVVPVTPRHHRTIHKKHRHYHHVNTSTQRASAKGMISHAHMSKRDKDKLFNQFEEWHQRQQLYQLFNPIEHRGR